MIACNYTKKLANLFIEEKEIKNKFPFTNNKLYEFEMKIDKSFFDMNEQDFVNLFFCYIGINTVATIDIYRGAYSKFYDWCIENGYTNSKNIFENSVELDPDAMAGYMSKLCPNSYFSDNGLEMLCTRITYDKYYTETLVRCFYEGCSSFDDLIYLKKDKVDLNAKKIYLKDRTICISDKLCLLLQMIMNTNNDGIKSYEIGFDDKGYTYQRFAQDDVFYYRLYNDSIENRKRYMWSKIKRLSDNISFGNVTIKKLYQSGLLQTIFDECNKDVDKLIHILYENKNKKTNDTLDKILKDHGYKLKSNRVRSMFKPYILQIIATR